MKPTIERTPAVRAARAASTIARASGTVLASGFSQSTCLPAASAAMVMSAWLEPGVQMSTSCTSSRLITSSQSVSTESQPSLAAAAAAAARFRPHRTDMRTSSGRSKTRPTLRQAWEWAAPMKA